MALFRTLRGWAALGRRPVRALPSTPLKGASAADGAFAAGALVLVGAQLARAVLAAPTLAAPTPQAVRTPAHGAVVRNSIDGVIPTQSAAWQWIFRRAWEAFRRVFHLPLRDSLAYGLQPECRDREAAQRRLLARAPEH